MVSQCKMGQNGARLLRAGFCATTEPLGVLLLKTSTPQWGYLEANYLEESELRALVRVSFVVCDTVVKTRLWI